MPANLYGEAAGLLRGTADTVLKKRELDQEADKTAATVGTAGLNVVSDLAKQKMVGAQAIDLEREKAKEQMIELTEPLANGAAKATGDESWKKAIGKQMNVAAYSALLTHGIKNAATDEWRPVEVTEGNNTRTYLYNQSTGEMKPQGTSGTGKKSSKSGGGTGLSGTDKEFVKTFRQYQKDTEGFNYKMLSGLAATDQKEAEDLKNKLDFIRDNQDRFDHIQGLSAPAQTPTPKPTAAPGVGGDEEAKITDYLKQVKAKDTPANRAWAKRKISG